MVAAATGGRRVKARRAEDLFQEYLSADSAANAEDAKAFVEKLADQESAQTLEELAQILEDYHALREGRATSSDSRRLAGPQAGTVLGDYELLRPLGRGGMGVVWEARQLSLDRHVAVKVLHPHLGLSGRFLERFQREAQAAGRLHHSGVVTVHGVGEEGGTHFIVQELVAQGVSLERWLEQQEQAQRQQLPQADYRLIASWMHELAEALDCAHAAGVIHRDLKPGNILLQEEHPMLADFGLAYLSEEASISLSGEILGTPYYMSPEQTSPGGQVDARSDLFALGATFYQMLTLRRPFTGDSREQVIEAIRQEDPPSPRRLRSRMPEELAVICMKLLEKNSNQRYVSARALADDLQRFLAGHPILARPPSPWERSWKWVRRHPTPSLAMAVATVALAVIAGFYFQADRARDDAEAATGLAEQRLQIATAIEDFLIGLFEDAGPGGEANVDTPAGELLRRGSDRLERDQEQDPMIRAGLLMALGQVNRLLGNYEQAEAQLREALTLHEQNLFALDQRTLKARNQLGLLLLRRAKPEEAEQMLLAAQRGHEELYGVDSPRALENQGNLAYVYYAQGDADRAAPLLEASLRGTEARWGPDHFHTWSARNNLAALEMERGNAAVAEPLFEQLVAHRNETEGPREPSTLSALSNLARCEEDLGKIVEAEGHLEQLVSGCRATFGDDHPTTGTALRDLADLRRKQKQFEPALDLYREASAIFAAKLRKGHPAALNAREGVVRCLLALGRATEAMPLAQSLAADAHEADIRPNTRQRLLEQVQAALQDS